jgi:hypothetical protein
MRLADRRLIISSINAGPLAQELLAGVTFQFCIRANPAPALLLAISNLVMTLAVMQQSTFAIVGVELQRVARGGVTKALAALLLVHLTRLEQDHGADEQNEQKNCYRDHAHCGALSLRYPILSKMKPYQNQRVRRKSLGEMP